MKNARRTWMAGVVVWVVVCARVLAADWVSETATVGSFALAGEGRAAVVVVAEGEFQAVALAVADFAADVERVSGVKPAVKTVSAGKVDAAEAAALTKAGGGMVLVGTLGKNPWIDALVAEGKLEVSKVRGHWETFLIATVEKPFAGVERALVIVGSDRRGTAFGVYELSQAIGVSPWHWWADVVPEKKTALHVAAGVRKLGPPSVKYRGIFINDEDWGLQPWAAQTFEPENGGIGPKTYEKVFELLLRLKANTLWPAMHACTKPFNADPRNAALAEARGIVMGSSHVEPMLRNNVGEWTAAKDTYNYATNREGVLGYWEERMKTNATYESVFTLGMRGIHDSGMQGGGTPAEQIARLEKIFADQRALIAKYVKPEVEQVPQMFCAYKEVLGLFRGGLKVPDDVTVVFPDDNFGYIRDFPSETERGRKGGFGVYYHISYLGRPLSYLWLNTTPPALIWSEMRKAYDHGADRLWIVNVGDIKPAEIGTEFFLQMAWDIERWNRENLPEFLVEWAAREFGREYAKEIAAIMEEYYRLNFARKPEHLQWWLPRGEEPRPSGWTEDEVRQQIEAFAAISPRASEIHEKLGRNADAFYQLVEYPVIGSTLANIRYFSGELQAISRAEVVPDARVNGSDGVWRFSFSSHAAEDSDKSLIGFTEKFGEIAGGKWRGFMRLEPADDDWKSMRIAPWKVPTFSKEAVAKVKEARGAEPLAVFAAKEFSARKVGRGEVAWQVVPGLGRSGNAVTLFPLNAASFDLSRDAASAPFLEYAVEFPAAGTFSVRVHLLPTHALVSGRGLRFGLGVDDAAPQVVTLDVGDGGPTWAQGVLAGERLVTASVEVNAAGTRALRIYGVDAGVVIDRIEIGAVAAPAIP
ncbi:hypothetical protein CMV30_11205 [Nibricoccus aquaticus]|uniref:Gylcosyl hydrolase 115 C-terminal domain-containing protein n=1 Tax=Nibricoccus aquaticus TaxID=2576891 RepID=A0A290QBN1_9BACT|nr:glycosyl hydrolase 115 family protein [Nibricoccus aquaticus]ATC66105.1 hypothetical protein CMV30_11205 [Nibricoccus aquaticus]